MSEREHRHDYLWSKLCGAFVCLECEDHKRLARCWCGWSKTDPGRGREELIEMGETIEREGLLMPEIPKERRERDSCTLQKTAIGGLIAWDVCRGDKILKTFKTRNEARSFLKQIKEENHDQG